MTNTSPTNARRAHWGELCIRQFIELTGSDREDSLGDLLANLMHWARLHSFDFNLALERAQGHFEIECIDEDGIGPEDWEPSLLVLARELARLLAAVQDARTLSPIVDLDVDAVLFGDGCAAALARARGMSLLPDDPHGEDGRA